MRKTYLLASLVYLSICPCVLAAGGVLPGAGTEASPYLIEDVNDFDAFASDPNYWASGVHTQLTTDIDLAGRTYTTAVIAPDTDASSFFQGTYFTGIFNGNSHTISNLTIDTAGADNDYLGLFGCISGSAEVKDIGVADVNIIGGNSSERTGGLCGENSASSISNCYSTGVVTGGLGSTEIGGLCGWNGGTVRDCFVYNGTVIARYKGGGLIGYNRSGLIENSYFMGSVALPDSSGGHDIGGLIGRNDDEVSQCFAIADVNAVFDAGGLIGRNEGVITNCYSQGTLSGFRYIGGLIGVDNSPEALLPAIKNCYTSTTVYFGSGSSHLAGGFVGVKHLSTYKNCFWNTTLNPELTGVGDNLSDPNIIGLSTQQMKQQANFTDWDFVGETANGTNDIWRMCVDGVDYPRLWYEFAPADFVCGDGVDLVDFAYLGQYWGLTDCDSGTDCGRADIDASGDVGLGDLLELANDWLN